MGNQSIKRRLTEYSGTVFDSKCEAVFARSLDIVGHEWYYHPVEHCGHEWDFLVFPKNRHHCRRSFYTGKREFRSQRYDTPCDFNRPMLIEYKPSTPTFTYINELIDKTSDCPVESIVVFGNPWKGIDHGLYQGHCKPCSYRCFPIFSSFSKYGWGNFCMMSDSNWTQKKEQPVSGTHCIYELLGITEEIAQQAKEFRFDLL